MYEPPLWITLLRIASPLIGALVFILFLPVLLCQAWVFTILWEWFVVPTLHVQALSLGNAYGLILILSLFRAGYQPPPKDEPGTLEMWGSLIGALIGALIGPVCILAVGWIVKNFL
jgi:hypothetical protein